MPETVLVVARLYESINTEGEADDAECEGEEEGRVLESLGHTREISRDVCNWSSSGRSNGTARRSKHKITIGGRSDFFGEL